MRRYVETYTWIKLSEFQRLRCRRALGLRSVMTGVLPECAKPRACCHKHRRHRTASGLIDQTMHFKHTYAVQPSLLKGSIVKGCASVTRSGCTCGHACCAIRGRQSCNKQAVTDLQQQNQDACTRRHNHQAS